jgi:hypothetical protein
MMIGAGMLTASGAGAGISEGLKMRAHNIKDKLDRLGTALNVNLWKSRQVG